MKNLFLFISITCFVLLISCQEEKIQTGTPQDFIVNEKSENFDLITVRLRVSDTKALLVEYSFNQNNEIDFLNYEEVDSEKSDRYGILNLTNDWFDITNNDIRLFNSDNMNVSQSPGGVSDIDYSCDCKSVDEGDTADCQVRRYLGNLVYCDGTLCTACSLLVSFVTAPNDVEVYENTSIILTQKNNVMSKFNFLFILSSYLITTNISAQNYITNVEDQNEEIQITINVDLDFISDGIRVEKSKDIDDINYDEVDQNSLVLMGEFEFIGENIKLNYLKYNYYWIPFKPEYPFYSINQNLDESITNGLLIIENYEKALGLDPGDITYYCTCGGHTPDSETPGGCLSSLNDGVIDCIDDSGCDSKCIGTVVEHKRGIDNGDRKYVGGGIFIQTSKEKTRLIHNYDIDED